MLISFRTLTVLLFLVATLSLVTCGEKESAEPGKSQSERGPGIADSTRNIERISVVSGGGELGGEEELKPIDPETYSDWPVAYYENIKVLCPGDHVHRPHLQELARTLSEALRADCRFFGINVPRDTIVVLYYTGPGQAKEITGRHWSFSLGDTLHYWLPDHLGLPIVKYLLPKWQSGEPRFRFLKYGLMALLDNSGENYHKRALVKYETGMMPQLSLMAADTTRLSERERQVSALSASFVDFIVYRYGITTLAEFYTSEDDFEQTTQRVFGITSDSLQMLWVGLLQEVVPTMEN